MKWTVFTVKRQLLIQKVVQKTILTQRVVGQHRYREVLKRTVLIWRGVVERAVSIWRKKW